MEIGKNVLWTYVQTHLSSNLLGRRRRKKHTTFYLRYVCTKAHFAMLLNVFSMQTEFSVSIRPWRGRALSSRLSFDSVVVSSIQQPVQTSASCSIRYAEIPAADVESKIQVADFRQVSPLYVTYLTRLELIDVFRTKRRWSAPKLRKQAHSVGWLQQLTSRVTWSLWQLLVLAATLRGSRPGCNPHRSLWRHNSETIRDREKRRPHRPMKSWAIQWWKPHRSTTTFAKPEITSFMTS